MLRRTPAQFRGKQNVVIALIEGRITLLEAAARFPPADCPYPEAVGSAWLECELRGLWPFPDGLLVPG